MGSTASVSSNALDREHKSRSTQDSEKNGSGRLFGFLAQMVFSSLLVVLLYVGWINRDEQIWMPDNGIGYALGIVGGILMLLLLLYPLQKRWMLFGRWLKIKYFFRLHMIFGALGPVLILLHSNYHLSSINGRVALFSMLAVAISGLFGRYFYRKIHHGLYGRRASVEEFCKESKEITKTLSQFLERMPEVRVRLDRIEQSVDQVPDRFFPSMFIWTRMRLGAAKSYSQINRRVAQGLDTLSHDQDLHGKQKRELKTEVRKLLKNHKSALIHMVEIRFYERLFSLWHILHLPLFIMMVITGFVHVYAVHVY